MLFDSRLDKLGDVFVTLGLAEKHGISFSEYVEMVRSGRWQEVTEIDARCV
jgi:DNA polymerase II small subunit/DNA polymerase delta subunit B